MDNVECEKCPIKRKCLAYKEAYKDNNYSYHRQEVVRVCDWDCPLVKLITPKEEK